MPRARRFPPEVRERAVRMVGLQVSDAKPLKALEEEKRRLKRLVADQALNLKILKDVLGKGA